MAADQVFVLVVMLGVAALLAWAEIRNRRRQASEADSDEQTLRSTAADGVRDGGH